MSRTALLAGASGLTGGILLTQLLADARYAKVHALVRNQALAKHKKLTEHVIDFERIGALPKMDDVFCCLGTTIKKAGSKEAFRRVDFDYVVNVARAAKASGAKRFLVMSSLGANAKSTIFYSRVKGEMEAALDEFGFDELHIFQPSLLAGDRAKSHVAERMGEQIGIAAFKLFSPLLMGPAKKYRAIAPSQVAHAMIAAAFSNKRGRTVYASDVIADM